ncbi:reverse transcriptase domain-containing protein [Tanacetum coccineum]
MDPKKTTTPMTDAAIKQLIAQGVADALDEYEATKNSRNGDDSHYLRSGRRRTVSIARECTYSDFLKCQPFNFKGTEGVVGLTQWLEKMESVFHISNYTVACQIKFATCTLLGNALTWWNSHVKTVSHDAAYGMTWKTLKKMTTDKYCPRSEIKKFEIEIWNLKDKGTVVVSYTQCFQELALMCGRMFLEESDEVEKYVGGLPDMIQGSVMASKPKIMQDAIEFTNYPMIRRSVHLLRDKLRTKESLMTTQGTIFRELPYPFFYPMRRLTMEEILAKFIDEGRRKHKEMEIFIKEYRITNELLLKTQSNLLRVTTRGGKMTSEATRSKEINETGINKNEPPRFKQDVQEKPPDNGVENKSSSIREKAAHPLVKPQQSSIPFPNRVRKEKEKALQQKFLENLKQLDINISFIEALLQIPKYAKYLKSLPTNKSRLEEALLEKHKEAEDLAADHFSRFESPHMEVLTEREIADEFSDEHLMVLKSKFKDDERWYADFVNYIVRKVVPPNWTFEKRMRFFSQVKTYFWEEPYAFKLCADNIMRRCVAGSETLEILAHCHSGPTGGHHSANITAKKLNELAELRDGAYENTRIYKERTKKWHDSRLRGDKDFKVGDKVLLYNSRLKMYPGKLKLKWSGPNIVKTVYPYGAIEITNRDGFSFKVNGQRLKKYYGGDIDKEDDEVIELENEATRS